MKTLKIIALLCFILGFTSKVNAQTVVTKDVQSNAEFGIDCANEWAIGTINFHLILHYNKDGILIRWQQLVTGEVTGETTGTIYSIRGTWQDNLQLETSNGANTDNSQIIYRMVGISGPNKSLSTRFHGLWHLVFNPSGDIQVVFYKATLNCE